MTYLIFLLGISFNGAASYTLKLLAAESKHLFSVTTLYNPLLYLACTLFAVNIMLYALLLQRVNLTVGYPAFVGGTFVVVLICSLFLLKETISPTQLFGVMLILGGILISFR